VSPQLNIIAPNLVPDPGSAVPTGEREGNGSTVFGDMLKDLRNVSGEELPKFATEKEKDSSEGDYLLQWTPISMNLGSIMQSQPEAPLPAWSREQAETGLALGVDQPSSRTPERATMDWSLPTRALQGTRETASPTFRPHTLSSLYSHPAVVIGAEPPKSTILETSTGWDLAGKPSAGGSQAQEQKRPLEASGGGGEIEDEALLQEASSVTRGPAENAESVTPVLTGFAQVPPSALNQTVSEASDDEALRVDRSTTPRVKDGDLDSLKGPERVATNAEGSWTPVQLPVERVAPSKGASETDLGSSSRVRETDTRLAGGEGGLREGLEQTSLRTRSTASTSDAAAESQPRPSGTDGRSLSAGNGSSPASFEGPSPLSFDGRVERAKAHSEAPVALEARIVASDEVKLSRVAQAVTGTPDAVSPDNIDLGRKLLARVLANKMGRGANDVSESGKFDAKLDKGALAESVRADLKDRVELNWQGNGRVTAESPDASFASLKRTSNPQSSEQATVRPVRSSSAYTEIGKQQRSEAPRVESQAQETFGFESTRVDGDRKGSTGSASLGGKLGSSEPKEASPREFVKQTILTGSASRDWGSSPTERSPEAKSDVVRVAAGDEMRSPAEAGSHRPLQEVRLKISAGEQSCEVQVTSRNSSVEVRVRTPDSELTDQLRGKLAELAEAIEKRGMHIASWTPGETAPASVADQMQGQFDQNPREQDQQQPNKRSQLEDADARGGHQRRQEEWEKALDQIMGLSI
jgi:hypothetical protein